MQVNLKKFLFIGLEKDRNQFFIKAQEAGVIHFISRQTKSSPAVTREVEKITKALRIMHGLSPLPQETLEEYHLGDGIAYKVVDLHEKIEDYQEELKAIKLDIARISPFGNFSLRDLKSLEQETNRYVQFFCAKPGLQNIPPTAIYVNTDQGLDYYISISTMPIVTKDMIEMQIDTSLSELQSKQVQIEQDLELMQTKLKSYAKYNEFLRETLLHRLDKQNLIQSETYARPTMDGGLFAIEGWIPINKIDEMKEAIAPLNVFVEEIAIEPTETMPTYLENEGLSRLGEDLVNIYDTPSHEDKDPSLWVLLSFALFFSIIIGDGGYGLIFLASALFIHYKFGSKLKGGGKRFWKLMMVLSISCIFWGLFTNTFFAMSLSPTNPIRAYSPLTWLSVKRIEYSMDIKDETYLQAVQKYAHLAPVTDPREFLLGAHEMKDGKPSYDLADSLVGGILMELALVIGVVHLVLSMLRYIRRTWAFAGWILVLIGSFLYFPVYLGAPTFLNYVFGVDFEFAGMEGLILIGIGFILAWILSLFQHRLLGLFEPMTAIQILADVLSYLRLYALGLAGGIVAATINEFVGVAGIIFGTLLALVGHSLNILLAIMGGVIHGLRLNFIEWYHYSFFGGGKKFNPLRKLSNSKKEL